MKYTIRGTGETVELNTNNFMRQGGEGSTYKINEVVYKVCEPGKMIPEEKFLELAALVHPKIIKPEDIILDKKKVSVGYTMRLVPGNAVPLARVMNKAYRERENVTHDMIAALVLQIYDGIKNGIHEYPGYLQVDGNPLNYMVTSDHKDVYFIDVNSFQTPHFPATAIMPNIRYWQCGQNFTQLTDWYSFAIISWNMFTAIHPFQHIHPRFTNMKTAMVDQMKASISILDKDSDYPRGAVYSPFESVIPGGANGAYMQWYRARFCDDKELPPPDGFQAAITFVAKVQEIIGSNKFDINLIYKYAAVITGFLASNGKELTTTTAGIYVDNRSNLKLNGKVRVGFTSSNTPMALVLENGKAKIQNLETNSWTKYESSADDIMACEGRLYVKYMGNIYELVFSANGTPMQSLVANVMPNSIQLFDGVAIQDMFGIYFASIFSESARHRQIKLQEITQHTKIIEARYENNVLMIMVLDSKKGQHDRLIFRFSNDWSSYDVRKVENVLPIGLNFTVLDKGIVVCMTENEKIEIFSNIKDSASIKVISDPAIDIEMKLCHSGNQVRFSHGNKLYSFAVRP